MHFALKFDPDQSLTQQVAAIPVTVTSLGLSSNFLYNLGGAELAQALAAIPAGVTSLDLRGNGLGNKSGAELAQALAAIPATVTSLDLGWNDLGELSGAELAQALAAIPEAVTSLNLSWNGLGRLSDTDLKEAFGAIPSSVHTVDLRNNNFSHMSIDKLKTLKDALPFALTVHLDASDVASMSREQLFYLARMMPKAINVKVTNHAGASVTSGKVRYLQSIAGHVTASELYDINKSLPEELTEHVASFLSESTEIIDEKGDGGLNQHFKVIKNRGKLGFFTRPLDEKLVDNSVDEITPQPGSQLNSGS